VVAASTADAAEVARLRTALQVLGTAADSDCQQLIRLFAKVKPENASAEKVADLVTQFGSYTAVSAAVARKYGEAVVAEYKPVPVDAQAQARVLADREQAAALEAKLAAAEQAAAAATALGEELKRRAAAEAERAAAAQEKLAAVEAEAARNGLALAAAQAGSNDASARPAADAAGSRAGCPAVARRGGRRRGRAR
jgi:colicin import membrane protein